MSNKYKKSCIFKIVLAGDGGVGKSSLISRYVTNKFTTNYMMTIGLNFMTKNVIVDNKAITFQIWDAAGQDRFRPFTDIAFQGAFGALYVFDLTRPGTLFEGINNWVEKNKELNSQYNNCIQLLIGNKSDTPHDFDKESVDDFLRENPEIKIQGYYETSALTGDNVETVFMDLGALIADRRKII